MLDALKQKLAYNRFRTSVSRAFPAALRDDVAAVLDALPCRTTTHRAGVYELGALHYTLPGGETVRLPYRIYLDGDALDSSAAPAGLTAEQSFIYHCLLTRHNNGYVREAHLRALLEALPETELPDRCLPFLLMEAGDYVVEILDTLYTGLRDRDNTRLQAFCRLNLQAFLYTHARMVSYWDYYYRDRWYFYRDYIGKRLFEECLGYTRSMERERRRFRWGE